MNVRATVAAVSSVAPTFLEKIIMTILCSAPSGHDLSQSNTRFAVACHWAWCVGSPECTTKSIEVQKDPVTHVKNSRHRNVCFCSEGLYRFQTKNSSPYLLSRKKATVCTMEFRLYITFKLAHPSSTVYAIDSTSGSYQHAPSHLTPEPLDCLKPSSSSCRGITRSNDHA